MRLDLAARPRRRTIGLTPLIDVVFILLLFFMLASHFHQWRTLTVSSTAQHGSGTSTPAILVRLHGNGTLDLNGEDLPPDALIPRLGRILQRQPSLAVQIQSDNDVPLQALVTLFDQLNAAGVNEMSLR